MEAVSSYEGNRQHCFLIVCDLLIEISVDQTHFIMMKKDLKSWQLFILSKLHVVVDPQ